MTPLTAHLLRGLTAGALLWWAFVNRSSSPMGAVAAALFAVLLMRGCPLCWVATLIETVALQKIGRFGRRW